MALNSNVIAEKSRKSLWQFISTEAHTDANMVRYINTCVRTICDQYNFDFNKYTQNITTDWITTEYTIKTVIQVYHLFNSAWEEISPKAFEDYYEDFTPTWVCIQQDKFITSDADTFKLIYRGYPDNIASLWDLIPVPDYFEEAVVFYCVKEWLREVKQFERMWIYTWQFDRTMQRIAATQQDPKPKETVRLSSNHTF